MWTSANRGRYDRSKLRYPSDLTDAEWALVRPLIPPAKRGGDKRTVDVREVVNGLFYVLSTGCQWRAMPKDLPPRSTVHGYFDLWTWDGTLDRIHFALYQQCREQAGREVQPSAAIIDVPEFQYVVITGDIAGSVGRGDYTAFLVWGYRDDIWYLIAAHRDRLDLPGVVRFFRKLDQQYEPDVAPVEKNGLGASFVQRMNELEYLHVLGATVTGDKLVRVDGITPLVERKQVAFLNSMPLYDAFMAELLSFPSSKNDDMVDAFSFALTNREGILRMANTYRRPKRKHLPRATAGTMRVRMYGVGESSSTVRDAYSERMGR